MCFCNEKKRIYYKLFLDVNCIDENPSLEADLDEGKGSRLRLFGQFCELDKFYPVEVVSLQDGAGMIVRYLAVRMEVLAA